MADTECFVRACRAHRKITGDQPDCRRVTRERQHHAVPAVSSGTIADVVRLPGVDRTVARLVDKDGNIMQDRVSNTGLLQADGGQVIMTAKDAGDVIRHVINQEGIVRARTVVEKDGKIILSGGGSGTVNIAGTLDASGDDAGRNHRRTSGDGALALD